MLTRIALVAKYSDREPLVFEPQAEIGLTERNKEVALLYWRYGLKAREVAEELGITEAAVRYHLGKVLSSDYMVVAFGEKKSRRGS